MARRCGEQHSKGGEQLRLAEQRHSRAVIGYETHSKGKARTRQEMQGQSKAQPWYAKALHCKDLHGKATAWRRKAWYSKGIALRGYGMEEHCQDALCKATVVHGEEMHGHGIALRRCDMQWHSIEMLRNALRRKKESRGQKPRLFFVQYSKLINPIFLV